MTTLDEIFKLGVAAYKGFNSIISSTNRFHGLEVKGQTTPLKFKPVGYSNYLDPIDHSPNRLAGFGRGWGQASPDTQHQVMDLILDNSVQLSPEDRAVLLATARIESGFNPDAAALSTSASGIFQLIKETANNLGLSQNNIFDAQANIKAGIKLFEENAAAVDRRYPKLSGDERAIMLYAFHHDGPSLGYGGISIARQQLVPFLDDFRALTYKSAFNEDY